MSNISDVTTANGIRMVLPFRDAAAAPKAERAEGNQSVIDQVEISEEAASLAERERQQPIRFEKVARIRAQIQQGTYDVNGKLDVVLDRLINDLKRG